MSSPLPLTQAGSSTRPARAMSAIAVDQREREPALLGPADPGAVDRHRARASARACVRPDDVGRDLELGQRVADARGCAGAAASAAASSGVGLELRVVERARRRRRSRGSGAWPAAGRTTGPATTVIDDRGHAPPQPVDARHERLGERRAAVRLDRGEQLEDLEPLARAAVGRERPSSGGALTVSPTARFSPSALSAIDAAARTATSVVESSPLARLVRRRRGRGRSTRRRSARGRTP